VRGSSAVVPEVGEALGSFVGSEVGVAVGPEVGKALGSFVGSEVGVAVGEALGSFVGDAVGFAEVGSAVGLEALYLQTGFIEGLGSL